VECNGKCRHLKNWTERDFAAGVYLLESATPPRFLFRVARKYGLQHNPISPTLTHFICTVDIFTQRRVGEFNKRERERGNMGEYRLQNWVENTNMTECTTKYLHI
jgi:hypothetical protein